jgi:hypothetical protein
LLPHWGSRIALGIEPLAVEQWLKDLKRERGFANPTLDKTRYDASALGRFFKEGTLNTIMSIPAQDQAVHISTQIKRLWRGNRPGQPTFCGK